MSDYDDEQELEYLEDGHDALEDIVRAAGEMDHQDYLKDLKVRVRKAGGILFLSLTWYRRAAPKGSIVRAPAGYYMWKWTKGVDKDGVPVWENGIKRAEL